MARFPALAGHRNSRAKRRGRPHEPAHATHCHVPVRQGTRLRLGRPAGGVQTGWQTSSGRLAAADSGWFGCETAGVAAKRRVRPAGGCDDSGAGRSTGTCGPAALTLGRQATGGATGAPREFQREQAPGCGLHGSVLRVAGHRNSGGATVRATTAGAGARGHQSTGRSVRAETRREEESRAAGVYGARGETRTNAKQTVGTLNRRGGNACAMMLLLPYYAMQR